MWILKSAQTGSAVQGLLHRSVALVGPTAPLRVASSEVSLSSSKEIKPFPKDFKEYPERDLENFPHPERRLWPNKVRMGFLPDSWFQFFYNKTGVTGPYLFGGGLTMFLLQKEIWVIEHEFRHLPVIIFMIWGAHKMFGKNVSAFLDKELDKEDHALEESRTHVINECKEAIETENHMQWCYQGMDEYLFDAKRQNVGLQLEAAYRQRIATVHDAVKRRVDYLAEVQDTQTRFKQRYMVDWIIDQVRKGITEQQEKATLQQCIVDLKSLAKPS